MVMMALTTGGRLDVVAAGALLVWIAAAAMVAVYGTGRGFRGWPLFLAALFLGFPIVLLAVTVAPAPLPPSDADATIFPPSNVAS